MKDQTILKLSILEEKNVISSDTKGKVEQIDQFLKSMFKTFEEHDSDFLFTHLAMTIDRVAKNKQLTDINEIILKQLKQSEVYPKALQLLQAISQLIEMKFNEAETVMLLVHFCSLIEMRG